MKVTQRVCDVKRHTVGFIVNNNLRTTRGQVVKLTRRGKIDNLVAKKGVYGWYVAKKPSADGWRLSELKEVVVR